MNQTIRIIGGKYRGRKLHFPESEGLRPTSDRVRETLFNWLMHDIQDARCLDAFAGSGALGFEAWSRGASRVVFVEHCHRVYANLKKLADSFSSSSLSVVKSDAKGYLLQVSEVFDIIFLDPPFSHNNLLEYLAILAKSRILGAGGLVYVESAQEVIVNSACWENVKLKCAGNVVYGLYKKLLS